MSRVALLAALLACPALAADPHKQAVASFYELRERTLDERGTPADVERLLALMADAVRYEHPKPGVAMTRAEVRAGMLAHLNEGKGAKYQLKRARFGKDFAVVEVTLDYTVDGKRVVQNGAALFEFRGNKISRVAEY